MATAAGAAFFSAARSIRRPVVAAGLVRLVRLVRLRAGQELWAESELLDETGVLGERLENVRFFQQSPDFSRARDPAKPVERGASAQSICQALTLRLCVLDPRRYVPRARSESPPETASRPTRSKPRALEGADSVRGSGKKFLSRDAFAGRRGRLAEGEGVREGESRRRARRRDPRPHPRDPHPPTNRPAPPASPPADRSTPSFIAPSVFLLRRRDLAAGASAPPSPASPRA